MSSHSLPDSASPASHAQATRTRTLRSLAPRKSLAESPPTQLPVKRHRPRRAAKDRLFPIRNIIDEYEGSYLIDWEDDPVTGVAWPQSWEPKSHVTKKAIQAWESTRREELKKLEGESSSRDSQEESSQESQPVRTAKRKRKSSVVEKELEVGLLAGFVQHSSGGEPFAELDHLHKRARKVGTVETARFSTYQTKNVPVTVREEIPDSFEEKEESLDLRSAGQVRIVIPYKADFNREAYPTAAKSAPSTQEYAPIFPSPLRNLVGREITIPDSQEAIESSPYQSTSNSRSGIEAALETDVSQAFEPESLTTSSLEYIPSAQLISVPISTQSLEPLVAEENCHALSINLEQAPAPVLDDEEHQRSTLSFSGPRAQSEDLQFQAQVPFFHDKRSGRRESVNHSVRGTSMPATGRPGYYGCNSVPFLDSNLSEASQERQISSQPKESKTSSGPDETWHSAQVIPAIDFPGSRTGPSAQPGSAITVQAAPTSPTCQLSTSLDLELNDSLSFDQPRDHIPDQSPGISLSIEKAHEPKPLTQTLSSSKIDFPGTCKAEYPPCPEISSDFGMADEELSYLEKVQRTREASRLKFLAKAKETEQARINSQQSTRSPSNASSVPPAATVDMVDSSPAPNLPIREPSPNSTVKSMEEDSAISEDKPSPAVEVFHLPLPVFGPADRIITLPIISSVRDVYEAEVRNNKQDIKSFVNNRQTDIALIQRIDIMVERLNLITDHQDLADTSGTQSSLSEEMEAKWAETASSKCLFTREFLDALRFQDKHVAILARPGRMLDILELVLKVNKFAYYRPDRMAQSSQDAIGFVQVTLLPTGLGGPQYVVARVDIVIAFDETFRKGEEYSRILRTGITEPQKVSLLISLVVANSAEYMELCLPKTASPLRRKRALVRCIWQKRGELGNLDKYPSPDEAAVAVADFLVKDPWNDSLWPLPENPQIDGVRPMSDEPVEQQSGSTTQSTDEQQFHASVPSSSIKRTLDVESPGEVNNDSKKRMRMTPSPGNVPSSGDITRVSESTVHLSPPKLENNQVMKDVASEEQELEDNQSISIKALKAKVTELENDVLKKDAQVRSLAARNEDYIKSIRNIQPKYREAIQDRGTFEIQARDAQVATTTLTQRIEARVADIRRLNDEKAVLESEVEEARAVLKLSPDSLVVQLETALEKGRVLEVENTRLEKRVSSLQKDFDFTRESYQKASTAAAEFSNELSELKEAMVVLERKASENTLRIAQIQRSNEGEEREARITELNALLKERESELQKKSEELKAKTNGRRETRGTSVPRSPRMGSGAMSPRAYARIPAVGSRGNSPAPGDATREGFRDTVLFPSSGVAPHRWQHLT